MIDGLAAAVWTLLSYGCGGLALVGCLVVILLVDAMLERRAKERRR